MLRILPFVLLLAVTLVPSHTALGQRFEGVIHQRTMTIEEAAIQDLLFGDGDEEDIENETEEAYTRRMAHRLFEMSMDRVMAAARDGGEVADVTTYVKGNKVRSGIGDADSPFAWAVVDLDAGTVTMVNEQEQYFVRWTREEFEREMQAMGLPTGGGEAAGVPPQRHALNRTVVVGGQTCRGFELMSEEGEFAWGWVTDGYPALQQSLRDYGERAGSIFGDEEDEGPSIDDLLYEHGFPMRMQRLYGGFGYFSSYEVEEVLSIEQEPVPDATFAVPAGFAQKSLKELWGR